MIMKGEYKKMKNTEKNGIGKFEDKIESLLDSWANKFEDKPVVTTIKFLLLIWVIKVIHKTIKNKRFERI